MKNNYLNQSNFFTRSIFKLEKDVHKDFVYLIQNKIDFFGKSVDHVNVSYQDYLNFKGVKKNDTYSFEEFKNFAQEIKNVGGAFYNKANSKFISFNLVDNIQIDEENPETLKVELANFGKIFFIKEELDKYITSVTPYGLKEKYKGHTQIEKSVGKLKGWRRKKFFEIISQFKNTGFCKISFQELKMYLGYIEYIDKSTKSPLPNDRQLKMIFIAEDNYEMIDHCPRYSIFERDFLKPAIKLINSDNSKDINNLIIREKIKSGRKVTHLVFTFNALGKELTEEESKAVTFFTAMGLDKSQVLFLVKRIGFKEMYGRYQHQIDRKVVNESRDIHYVERSNGNIIKTLSHEVCKFGFRF